MKTLRPFITRINALYERQNASAKNAAGNADNAKVLATSWLAGSRRTGSLNGSHRSNGKLDMLSAKPLANPSRMHEYQVDPGSSIGLRAEELSQARFYVSDVAFGRRISNLLCFMAAAPLSSQMVIVLRIRWGGLP